MEYVCSSVLHNTEPLCLTVVYYLQKCIYFEEHTIQIQSKRVKVRVYIYGNTKQLKISEAIAR